LLVTAGTLSKISFVFKAFLLVVAPKHLPLPQFAILGGVFVWLKPFISTHFTRALLSSVHHSVSFIAIAFVLVLFSSWKCYPLENVLVSDRLFKFNEFISFQFVFEARRVSNKKNPKKITDIRRRKCKKSKSIKDKVKGIGSLLIETEKGY